MKKTFAFLTFLSFFASPDLFAATKTYTVSKSDIQNGFIIERVNLNSYDLPAVHFSNPVFTPVSALPKGAAIMATGALKLIMGMERKQPFVLVSTPAFSKNDQGELQQLSSFTLDITETGIATTAPALKGTSVNSVLATGTWYKIAVPSRGVYKVDYNFIQSQLGVSGTINSANIRVFGNGGTMLSEANNVPRAEDLVENALSVNDGGDGTLNGSDYFTFYANGPMAWVKDSVGQRFTHRKIAATILFALIKAPVCVSLTNKAFLPLIIPLPLSMIMQCMKKTCTIPVSLARNG